MYTDRVRSKYNNLNRTRNTKWSTRREYLVTSVNEIIPKKIRQEKISGFKLKATTNNGKEWYRIYNIKDKH